MNTLTQLFIWLPLENDVDDNKPTFSDHMLIFDSPYIRRRHNVYDGDRMWHDSAVCSRIQHQPWKEHKTDNK
jgi:hypothetical protein